FIVSLNQHSPVSTLFPYTTLFRSDSYEQSLALLDLVTRTQLRHGDWEIRPEGNLFKRTWFQTILDKEPNDVIRWRRHWDLAATEDRKSTRLNSSHDQISYAVFCLK